MKFMGGAIFVVSVLVAAAISLLPEPEGFPILEYHQVTDVPLDPDFEVYNVPPANQLASCIGDGTLGLKNFLATAYRRDKIDSIFAGGESFEIHGRRDFCCEYLSCGGDFLVAGA